MPNDTVSRVVKVNMRKPMAEILSDMHEVIAQMKAEGYVLARFDCYVKSRDVRAVFFCESSLEPTG